MCRNITTLRGLEPPATDAEIDAAARQFVRKISGIREPSEATRAVFERAVTDVAMTARSMLADLPPRRRPPPTLPPSRRGHPVG